MSVFDSLRAATGIDQFTLVNILFFAMVMLIWLVMAVLEKSHRQASSPLTPRSGHGSLDADAFAPKFADGWICRACWTSNRAGEDVCPRCGNLAPGITSEANSQAQDDLTFSLVGSKVAAGRAGSSNLTTPRSARTTED